MDFESTPVKVDWSLIKIWCCGQYFSSDDISSHTQLCHENNNYSCEQKEDDSRVDEFFSEDISSHTQLSHDNNNFACEETGDVGMVDKVSSDDISSHTQQCQANNNITCEEKGDDSRVDKTQRSSSFVQHFGKPFLLDIPSKICEMSMKGNKTWSEKNDVKVEAGENDDVPFTVTIKEEAIVHNKSKTLIPEFDSYSLDDNKIENKSSKIKSEVMYPSKRHEEKDECSLEIHVSSIREGTRDKSIHKSTDISNPKRLGKKRSRNVLYACDKCDYKTYLRGNLRLHFNSLHEGIRYKCDQCDDQFTQMYSLRKHKSAIHEGNRFQCDKCDHKSTDMSNLKRHEQRKHGHVLIECDKCDYKTKLLQNLKRHVNSVHEGIRYQCSECDYKATQKSSLKIHVSAIHEGFRYYCDKCDFKGTQKGTLDQHIKRIHPE